MIKKKKFEKLELGAGERFTPGFSRQDIDSALPELDLVCPAERIADYVEENSVQNLRATHLLEHFPTRDVPFVLQQWFTVLEPGGELYLEIPNFAWHAKLVAEGREEEAINYAFGGQLDEWDFHKTGFTPNLLGRVLLDTGFVDIIIEDGSSLTARAYKPS